MTPLPEPGVHPRERGALEPRGAPDLRASGGGAARLSLSRVCTGPRWGVLVMWMASLIPASCILPPEGTTPPPVDNYPPEIDRQSRVPFDVSVDLFVPDPSSGTSCRFPFAARIFDRDHSVLKIRWIADNNSSIVQPLAEDDDFTLPEGAREARITVDTRDLTDPLFDFPHVLSLFVTDGPGWDATFDELLESGAKRDGGRARGSTTDAGVPGGAVAEAHWILSFEQGNCRFDP